MNFNELLFNDLHEGLPSGWVQIAGAAFIFFSKTNLKRVFRAKTELKQCCNSKHIQERTL